jgi:MFS family permease
MAADDRETKSLLRSGDDDDGGSGGGGGDALPRVDASALGSASTSLGQLRLWWARLLQMFGGNFLGAIMLVYFLQGSRVGFTNLASDYYYQDPVSGLGLTPARAQVLITLSGVPWNLKPFYGILTDVVPLWGTHRRGYLGLMGTTATISYLVLALLPPNEWTATSCLFLISLGFAFNDVVVDAMLATGAKKEPATAAGNLQSLAWGSYACGSILGSIGGGVLYGTIGARPMFFIFGLIYAVTVAMAINLKEEPAARMSKEKLRLQARLLYGTIRVPLVWKAALYMFIMYAALPSVASATFKFWTDQDDLPRPSSFPPYEGWSHPLPPGPDDEGKPTTAGGGRDPACPFLAFGDRKAAPAVALCCCSFVTIRTAQNAQSSSIPSLICISLCCLASCRRGNGGLQLVCEQRGEAACHDVSGGSRPWWE